MIYTPTFIYTYVLYNMYGLETMRECFQFANGSVAVANGTGCVTVLLSAQISLSKYEKQNQKARVIINYRRRVLLTSK